MFYKAILIILILLHTANSVPSKAKLIQSQHQCRCDVALWMDSRAYYKQPALRQIHDFAFITPELHNEFDAFCAKHTNKYKNIFRGVEFLK